MRELMRRFIRLRMLPEVHSVNTNRLIFFIVVLISTVICWLTSVVGVVATFLSRRWPCMRICVYCACRPLNLINFDIWKYFGEISGPLKTFFFFFFYILHFRNFWGRCHTYNHDSNDFDKMYSLNIPTKRIGRHPPPPRFVSYRKTVLKSTTNDVISIKFRCNVKINDSNPCLNWK